MGRGTQVEKRFPRALFCYGEMLFGVWWVSTELFSPFPFSPAVGWSSGFWQGKHTWQAAALWETGHSVLGWGFGYVQKHLALEQGISQSHAPAGPGEESNNPDIQLFPLFTLKSIQGRALLSQAPLVPACRRCCLPKCALRGVKQTDAVPCWW